MVCLQYNIDIAWHSVFKAPLFFLPFFMNKEYLRLILVHTLQLFKVKIFHW